MKKTAFIFPGQASQYVGMGKDLYESYAAARRLFEQANEIMGMDLKRVCFEGPEEELKKTYITQPAIFVHSVIVDRILQERGMQPAAVAGHSLGEYSALVSAGSLTFEDGLQLVQKRGKLMFEAGLRKPGTMAAIIGLDKDQVEKLCRDVQNEGILQAANFNSPGQIAISGDVTAIRAALVKAKEMGARKAVELVVSGAFHSPLMQSAQEGLRNVLETTDFRDAEVPLYSNVEAKQVQDKEQIRSLLFRQLTKPVLWQDLIRNMIQDGYNPFYEIGPGKVLRGLLKRIDRSVPCKEVGTVEDIETIGEAI